MGFTGIITKCCIQLMKIEIDKNIIKNRNLNETLNSFDHTNWSLFFASIAVQRVKILADLFLRAHMQLTQI